MNFIFNFCRIKRFFLIFKCTPIKSNQISRQICLRNPNLELFLFFPHNHLTLTTQCRPNPTQSSLTVESNLVHLKPVKLLVKRKTERKQRKKKSQKIKPFAKRGGSKILTHFCRWFVFAAECQGKCKQKKKQSGVKLCEIYLFFNCQNRATSFNYTQRKGGFCSVGDEKQHKLNIIIALKSRFDDIKYLIIFVTKRDNYRRESTLIHLNLKVIA